MTETCECCRKERNRKGQSPRVLFEVPREYLKKGFSKNAPAWLCYYCDGDAYQLSEAYHTLLEEEEDVG